MRKTILLIILILKFSNSFSQINAFKQVNINGEINRNIVGSDSIMFLNGFVREEFFEISNISSEIKNKRFNLEAKLSYPHMYRTQIKSDKEKNKFYLFDGARYFIDSTTNLINIDSMSECSEVIGMTGKEYKYQFIPFIFLNKNYSCKSNDLAKFRFQYQPKFDSLLFDYVKINPNSYVALWILIDRFSESGYCELFEKTLKSFSDKMQSEKIWKILKTEFDNIKIKENEYFPIVKLKTINLNEQNLKLPKAKYTLIDFWFSRCKPCLETFPLLKQIYSDYNSQGFEIIQISIDRIQDIALWQKRIQENDLKWSHYLDENGVFSKENKILKFPTTFLLDENGLIIKKDIELKDLEIFLKNHL